TDISKDGQLSGTNLEIYQELSQIKGLDIVASGGISYEKEIVQLKKMNLYAAIVGKAIYTDTLQLDRVIQLAK
ncbi:MAG: 1-(5-phosphoribosyl)-5-((5-phosphoribosylamino)methylideneamino)imidazole-4-carboxamide isomerase, partial [Massilioclostridium sp.]